MKKVAIYIRVSTQEQAKEGYSIGAQKERLISYCQAKGWLIQDIYIDGGFTGSNLDRPAMQKMLSDMGKYEIVLVYRLDRLSRSQRDTLYLIEERFLKNDIDFVSLSESFDTTTPFGRAMIGILSVFAQLERETITERSRLGRKERAREGLWHGGGDQPIGYDYDTTTDSLIINEYEAMQIQEIYKLYIEGKGLRQISIIMNEKGYTHKHGSYKSGATKGLRNILCNPLYIGKIQFMDELFQGKHEPIIDEIAYNKAQKLFDKRKDDYGVWEAKYLLSGFIYCGICGAKYACTGTHRNKYAYYRCYSKSSIKHMIKDPNCENTTWILNELESKIVDRIKQLKYNLDDYRKVYTPKTKNPHKNQNIIIQKKLADIDKQVEKMMDLYRFDKIPADKISEMIEKLYNEKKALESNLTSQEPTKIDFDFDLIISLLENFDDLWEKADLQEKRSILSDFIKKIVINKDEIEVEWVFM